MTVIEACGRTDQGPSLNDHASDLFAHLLEFHRSDHRLQLIAVVDGRRLLLQSLTEALSSDGTGFRARGYATLDDWRSAADTQPEVSALLFAIGGKHADMPETAWNLQALVSEFPRVPTIVIGDIETPAHVVQVLAYGIRGYIPTSLGLNVAIEAIRLAQAGGIFVPSNCLVQSFRQEQAHSATSAAPLSGLFTRQQAAVAEALRRGKGNKIIAYQLNLSEGTVKVHVHNIMQKLHARNRTEVAFKISSYLGQSTAAFIRSDAAMG